MKPRPFYTTLAIFLAFVFLSPTTFLIAPKHAYAIPVADAGNLVQNTLAAVNSSISVIKASISAVADVTASAALVALQIDAYVLQPLAFILSGNLLKAMTAGTIAFIIGTANGTGIPQFVADIQKSLQTVSDTHALSFFDQYIQSSRSPWNTAIVSQLSKEYLNKTSLAGFWAKNMDTLRRTSPNITGYLNGNWALGGVGSWFALTTQTRNNPYMLYPDVKNQLAQIIGPGVGGATGARVTDVVGGSGFVSWCGNSDGFLGSMTTNSRAGANAAAIDQAGEVAYNNAFNRAIAEEPDDIEGAKTLAEIARTNAKTAAFNSAAAGNAGNTFLGVSPGDPCTNADGTTGSIKTPGSVIVAGLNKVLGGQQDNVTRMGNVGPQINQILGSIGTVLKTVQFASQILGGPGSGGLLGVDTPNPGQPRNRSALQAYANATDHLGATTAGVLTDAAGSPSSGSDMLDRVGKYESAINTIRPVVNNAVLKVNSLIAFCTSQQQLASNTLSTGNPTDTTNLTNFMAVSTAQLNEAQNVLTTQINPVHTRVTNAPAIITAARAMVAKVQAALGSGVGNTVPAADLAMLQTMPPTPENVAVAEQDATTLPGSVDTNPPGSLSIVGAPSLIDRLNLISTNATALFSVCTAPAPVPLGFIPIP